MLAKRQFSALTLAAIVVSGGTLGENSNADEVPVFEASILSVFDRNSQLTGRRVYWQDITALKKDFDHLKYRFERLFFALEDTGDEAVWDFNLADGEAYFSTKYASLLGFKPDETKSSSFSDIISSKSGTSCESCEEIMQISQSS